MVNKSVETYGLHRRLEYFVILILAIVGIDQFVKYLVQQSLPIKYVVIDNVLWFTYVENFGAGFGIFQGKSLLLGIFSLLVVIGLTIYVWVQKLSFTENTAFALIIAGALGNAIDRFVFGFVIDFIDLGWWPVFNIADCALVIGVGILLVHTILSDYSFKKKRKSYKGKKK